MSTKVLIAWKNIKILLVNYTVCPRLLGHFYVTPFRFGHSWTIDLTHTSLEVMTYLNKQGVSKHRTSVWVPEFPLVIRVVIDQSLCADCVLFSSWNHNYHYFLHFLYLTILSFELSYERNMPVPSFSLWCISQSPGSLDTTR
jgi:hypothetical protein